MKMLVCLKPVQDPRGMTVNRKAQRVFVNRPGSVINPADRSALEAALRLKDSLAAEVVAVTVGDAAGARDCLLDARAMGADRAVRTANPGADSSPMDEAALAQALAALARREAPLDLVCLGAAALDTGGGQVGPRVAELLGWPLVGPAHSLSFDAGRVSAVKSNGAGWQAVTEDAPAVVVFPAGALRLRYAPAPAILRVFRDPDAIESLTASDLGVAPGPALTKVLGTSFPPERQPGSRLEGTTDEIAAALADMLRRDRS